MGAPWWSVPTSAAGSAYVFVRSGGGWVQQAKLTASDPGGDDRFGDAVDIHGDTVVVGAWLDDDAGASSGSAYVFVRSGTSWSQQAKLTAGDAAGADNFGDSVATIGDAVVVGSPRNDDSGGDSGSVYVFARDSGTWTQQQKLNANDGQGGDRLGGFVAIDVGLIAAGAFFDDDDGISSGSAYVFASQSADITVSNSGSPNPAVPGNNLTYSIDVTNAGPDAATGLILVDTLPAGLTFVSASTGCSESGGTVTCNLGGLSNGATSTITIVVGIPASTANGSTLKNSVSVTGTEIDPDPSNSTDIKAITGVTRQADLSITMIDSPDPVTTGKPLTYAIEVQNAGPSDAAGVTVTVALASGLTFSSASSGCTVSGGVVVCDIGSLAVGASAAATIIVVPGSLALVTNTATVTSADPDPNGSNNDSGPISTLVINTPTGAPIALQPNDSNTGSTPVTLTLNNVNTPGTTSLTTSGSGPAIPSGFALGDPPTFYDLSTTAEFTGSATVCIDYTGISFDDESALKLLHFEGSTWVDRTVSLDTVNNVICADVSSLSPFAVSEPSGTSDPPVFDVPPTPLLGATLTVKVGESLQFNVRVSDVDVLAKVTQISVGSDHTCALLNTGVVRCWGWVGLGQLGYGNIDTIGNDETPATAGDVDVGGTVTSIVVGKAHTCAVLDTGTVRCWAAADSPTLVTSTPTTSATTRARPRRGTLMWAAR